MLDSLHDVLKDQIKDLYSAETQLIKALPKMAKAASNPDLAEAFRGHLEETKEHAARLERIAQELETKPRGKVCAAMKGLIEEGAEVLEEDGRDEAIDAALIVAAQKVEHYEISGYGSARACAERLGLSNVVRLLEKTLDEEKHADVKLSELSTGSVLPALMSANGAESGNGKRRHS